MTGVTYFFNGYWQRETKHVSFELKWLTFENYQAMYYNLKSSKKKKIQLWVFRI